MAVPAWVACVRMGHRGSGQQPGGFPGGPLVKEPALQREGCGRFNPRLLNLSTRRCPRAWMLRGPGPSPLGSEGRLPPEPPVPGAPGAGWGWDTAGWTGSKMCSGCWCSRALSPPGTCAESLVWSQRVGLCHAPNSTPVDPSGTETPPGLALLPPCSQAALTARPGLLLCGQTHGRPASVSLALRWRVRGDEPWGS